MNMRWTNTLTKLISKNNNLSSIITSGLRSDNTEDFSGHNFSDDDLSDAPGGNDIFQYEANGLKSFEMIISNKDTRNLKHTEIRHPGENKDRSPVITLSTRQNSTDDSADDFFDDSSNDNDIFQSKPETSKSTEPLKAETIVQNNEYQTDIFYILKENVLENLEVIEYVKPLM